MAQHYSPSQVNQYLKGVLDRDGLLSNLWVEGEVCNYTKASSGHHYFSIKDSQSILSCIMYKNDFPPGFPLENGMKVLVVGRISLFPARGTYQLYAQKISLVGAGDLHQAFALLKQKLEQGGYFSPQHKKPLPLFPKTVALITSQTGAVVHDMIRILGARSPMTRVLVVPVQVQGEGAGDMIAAAIGWTDYYKKADLIIVGRGGGSAEDLQAFNEENLAMAIFHCQTPIISAVGHEPDISISDYVADRRANTPTHAAEMAVAKQEDLAQQLGYYQAQMEQSLRNRIESHRKALHFYANSPGFQDPKHHLREKAQMLDYQRQRLETASRQILQQGRDRCGRLSASLHALSPLAVMGRGYGIARTESGKVLHSVADTKPGEMFTLALADGTVDCETKKITKSEVDSHGRE